MEEKARQRGSPLQILGRCNGSFVVDEGRAQCEVRGEKEDLCTTSMPEIGMQARRQGRTPFGERGCYDGSFEGDYGLPKSKRGISKVIAARGEEEADEGDASDDAKTKNIPMQG